MVKSLLVRLSVLLWACSLSATAHALADTPKPVSVAPGDLIEGLQSFEQQTDVEVVYQASELKGLRTRGLTGTYAPHDAVVKLLEGTKLEVRTDQATGAMLITPSGVTSTAHQSPSGDQDNSSKEAGKNSSQEFRVAQVDQASAEPQSVSEQSKEKKTSEALLEVVVTGSRLRLPLQERAQKVDVYTSDDIDRSGQTTVTDFLNTLPAVSTAVTENGNQTHVGATTVALHGLPLGTTLILIDGRRVESSPAQQLAGVFFDLNNIPMAAVERIEVVSEGSSAVYGSDAIGGVINIILKKDITGLDAELKYGGAQGTHEANASLTWGTRSDRGSLSVVASYQHRTPLQGFDRSEVIRGADPDGPLPGFDFAPIYQYACNPGNVFFPSGFSFSGKPPVPYAAVPHGATGTPTLAQFAGTAGTLNSCATHNPFDYADFIPGTDRLGLLINGAFKTSENYEIFTQLMASHVQQRQRYLPSITFLGSPDLPIYTVGATNAYNPFGEAVSVAGVDPSAGLTHYKLDTTFARAVLGMRGSLGTWAWETSALLSEETSQYFDDGNANFSALTDALNSSNPATALNPFVTGPYGSPSLLRSLLFPDGETHYRAQTIDVSGFVRGDLFRTWAGPVAAVIGAEYEHDILATNNLIDPFSATGGATFARGSYAAFTELRVPLIAGPDYQAGRDTLDLTAAGRYDRYTDFGGKATPQFGLEFRPIQSILLRGTYSKAFKAPSLYALDSPVTVQPGVPVSDPMHGGQFVLADLISGGNMGLSPEEGTSRSVGVAYESLVIPGLKVSVTDWSIEETNSIQQLNYTTILDNEALFPGAVVRSPQGQIVSIRSGWINFGSFKVKGIDGDAAYKFATRVGTTGVFLRATDIYQYVSALTPGAPPIDGLSAAQDTGFFAPRWKGTAGLTWETGPLAASFDGRYTGKYLDYDSTKYIGDFWLFDGTVTIGVGQVWASADSIWRDMKLTVGGVNLFNRLPQNSNYNFGTVGYDPTEGDIRGRFLYLQLSAKL